MKRFIFLVLVIPVLACGTYVTPIPAATEVPNTPIPSTQTPEIVPTATNTQVENSTQTVTVVKATVNVRSEPDGAVVGNLQDGDPVVIIECAGDWCQIEDPAGYVWRGCLSGNEDIGCEAK